MTDLEQCARLQAEEVEVTQSIFGSAVSCSRQTDGTNIVNIELTPELEATYTVALVCDSTLPELEFSVSNRVAYEIQLSHLPPILLTLELPSTYPLHHTPSIRSLQVTHAWLSSPMLSKLRDNLERIMTEALRDSGDGTMWRVFEFVRDGSVFDALEIRSTLDTTRLKLCHPSPTMLAPLLLSYNTLSVKRCFESKSYPCPICLQNVKGSNCIRLDKCGHICCQACLNEFWVLSIQQGQVESVGCVDPECVRRIAKSADVVWGSVGEEEVRRVVGDILVQRWLLLREKRMIEQDPSIVRCPVKTCQAPVPRPSIANPEDDDEGAGWSRLRVCSSCDFSFCLNCRKTWHGPIAPCKSSATAEMLERYSSEPVDSDERRRLERQYGKKNITKMLVEHEEMKLNQAWLEKSTQKCPGCSTAVEKSEGCNHMKCGRCLMHFCFRCGTRLRGDNPYIHYSTRGLACYGGLFDYDPRETEWQPMAGFELI